ncbi:MAG: diaminopimelate epimerase [Terriglobia bacterium]
MMEIPFSKLHGLSNDFVVLDGRDVSESLPQLAGGICARSTGVGADGLVAVLPPRSRRHHARFRFFNADGSEAEMSGNGIRCAAAYLAARVGVKKPLQIETLAGLKTLQILKSDGGHWLFRVSMGKPILSPRKIPFKGGGSRPVLGFPLRTQRGVLRATITSMGNPHCTIMVGDHSAIDWARLGNEIENSELFPNRTNVEFVKVVSREEIQVRFWERGVGETMSSGTGSCAATVACILNGLTKRKVAVKTPGGELIVAWPEGKEVTLTGPAEEIMQGTYYYRG